MYNEHRKRLKPTADLDHRHVRVPQEVGGHPARRVVQRRSGQGYEQLLNRMDLLTVVLKKEEGKGLGMMIGSGKVRSGEGAVMEGVFVQKVLPGSLADKDGKITTGDLVVEIDDQYMVGRPLDEATQKLRDCTGSIKLRIGRPKIDHSVTDDGQEPIYVNELVGPAQRELFIKLEKAEIRIAELEGEKEEADQSLKAFKEEAEEDKKEIQKQMEQLRQEFDRHKSESQQNMTNLTQALANITLDKGKNDKELERLRELLKEGVDQGDETATLRQQLLEAHEAKKRVERSLENSKEKDQEVITLRAEVSELETQISQYQRERDSTQSDLQRMKIKYSSALEEVATLDTQNTELSRDLEQVRAETAQQASGRTAEVELSQKSQELSSARQELRQSRVEQERLSEQVAELSKALEREEAKRARLEESLQSQRNSERSNTADLLKKLQLQAKQITELKDELEKHSTPTPAPRLDHMEDDEHASHSVSAVLDASKRQRGEQDKMVKGAPISDKMVSGQAGPARQPQPKKHGAPVLPNGVRSSESKPKRPKPYDGPKPERPKPPFSEKPELSHPKPQEENVSAPQSTSPREMSREESDEETPSITALDAVKSERRLNSSTALHKSEMGAQLKRKRPSREHIRSKGSMTDILESLSVEDLLEKVELEGETVPGDDGIPAAKPEVVSRKESPASESTELQRPKPMPRAAPRLKISVPKPEAPPTGMSDGRRPQAAPRHKREHSDPQNHELETKPSPSHQRGPALPPRPEKPEAETIQSHKHTSGSTDFPVTSPIPRHKRVPSGSHTPEEKAKMIQKRAPTDPHLHTPEMKRSPRIPNLSQKPGNGKEESASPERSLMVVKQPMKPAAQRSVSHPLLANYPPALPPNAPKEAPEDGGHMIESPRAAPPPRPVQKHVRHGSRDGVVEVRALEHSDSKLDELMGKDPSELSVREKTLLAQKMLEKQKEHPPPSVPQKPSRPVYDHDPATAIETSPVRDRAKSFDNLENSPKRMVKILPGAINIFGSPMRMRSATVATDEPDAMAKRESIERSEEFYPELPTEPLPREDIDARFPQSRAPPPPKKPPPPMLKRPSDEKPPVPEYQHYETSTSILDQINFSELDIASDSPTADLTPTNESNPLFQAAPDDPQLPKPSKISYDNILEWSSDHVAIWLTEIGLGQYKQLFQDRGIQGVMLFDLDGTRLKALGVSSNDRSVLKKEVKALRSYADKQKKAMDKKRKEDKKKKR